MRREAGGRADSPPAAAAVISVAAEARRRPAVSSRFHVPAAALRAATGRRVPDPGLRYLPSNTSEGPGGKRSAERGMQR